MTGLQSAEISTPLVVIAEGEQNAATGTGATCEKPGHYRANCPGQGNNAIPK